MVRLGTYAAASAAGAVGIIYHAFHSRGQFYPAMLYLSTSKISLVLLLNMGLVIMCSVWQLIKTMFLGSLREAEVERLNEQSWREVMEILFAITIFREEFSVSFLAMVTVLLLIKAFHWLAQKRVEYIETTPSVSRLSHFRIISFLAFLLALDCIFLYTSVSYLLKTRRPSVSLFFSFEYVILATTTISTFLKYVFYVSDMLMEGQWENKAVFTFYLELVRDLLHLSLYLFFFLVIFINYGLPLHLIRELYETFRNFKSRVADFIRYRKITSNMNDRFPDATAEELGASDATCIICREEMVAAKKLPCGHLFHVHCLRSWLERQQTCPTCRTSVIASESGAAASGTQPDQHQHAGIEGGQTGLSGDAGLSNASGQAPGASNNSFAQHQARIQAAAAAAAQYGSSFVYHPIASLGNWSPGHVFVNEGYASMPLPYRGGRATNSDGQENNLSMDMQMQLGMQKLLQVQSQILAAQGLPPLPGCNSVYSQVPLYGVNPFHRSHAFAGTQPIQDGNVQGPSCSSQSFHQAISDWSVQLELQQMWLKQRIEMLQSELQSVLQLQNSLNSIPQGKGEACNSSTEGLVQHQDVSARAASGSLDVKGKALAGSEFKHEGALPTASSTDSASKDSLNSDGKTESTQSSHSEIEEVQSK